MIKITVKMNEYGHLEVWEGAEPDLDTESDVYIQQDEEVETALHLMNISSMDTGDIETVEDIGYFE